MKLKVGYSLACDSRALFGYYHNNQELIDRIESVAKDMGVIIPINKPRYWVFNSKDEYLKLDEMFKNEVLDDQWSYMEDLLKDIDFDIPAEYYSNIEVLRNQILTHDDIEVWIGWVEKLE